MESHIKEGKENLNFDQWEDYGNHKQKNMLERIVKQIKSYQMPLVLIHSFIEMESSHIIKSSKLLNGLKKQLTVSRPIIKKRVKKII